MTTLTIERLREVLSYDPETGELTWLNPPPNLSRLVGTRAGYDNNRGYRAIQIDEETFLVHRLAWFYVTGEWPEDEIDHKDLNRSNNRFSNLRPATHSENMANSGIRTDNTSGVRGVHFADHIQKWIARIQAGGRRHLLGHFNSREEARSAYVAASIVYHKEFGRAV